MGKLYTLDGKLLTETPEIRVSEKIYAVDNRKKTVDKILKKVESMSGEETTAQTSQEAVTLIMELALGPKAAKEIDDMNIPYPAYQKLFTLLMAAVTGEDEDEIDARFQPAQAPAAK